MPHTPEGTDFNTPSRIEFRSSEDGRGVYVGHGDAVVHLDPLSHSVNIATITHRGEVACSVWSVDRRGQDIDLLVSASGEYSGVVPLDFSGEPAALRVSADGDWTIEITPLNSAERWDGQGRFDGSGDCVVVIADMGAASVRARITVDGGSCIAVWSWGDRRELLVNQGAPSVGTAEIPDDAVVLAIRAEGRWSMAA